MVEAILWEASTEDPQFKGLVMIQDIGTEVIGAGQE
jgi:hypothetical protein